MVPVRSRNWSRRMSETKDELDRRPEDRPGPVPSPCGSTNIEMAGVSGTSARMGSGWANRHFGHGQGPLLPIISTPPSGQECVPPIRHEWHYLHSEPAYLQMERRSTVLLRPAVTVMVLGVVPPWSDLTTYVPGGTAKR